MIRGSGPRLDARQDLGTVIRHRDRVLEMGRQRTVERRDRPAVRPDLDVSGPEGEHRLNREADAGRELHPADARSVVRDLWLLVHLRADPVADELPDDPVAARSGDVLDGTRD